jgi:hypothetical protein
MRSQLYKSPLLFSALTTCFIAAEMTRAVSAQQPPPPQQRTAESQIDAEVETVLRGPLHEAFAEPVQPDPAPGLTISKQPPEPIDEIPPAAKPADESVVWIPGYWAWDDERNDFLWISGVWRAPPPDRRWVPGYWMEAEGGHQWISGFWTSIEAEEIAYLPPPPESLEEGPTSEPPSEDSYWVSGCWVYQDRDYAWRPGYWGTYRSGWVWLPAHYIWTPRGVIFIDGYWDYPLVTRGQIFASAYFRGDFYRRPGYRYSPSVSVNIGNLMVHLFVRPRHHHYYWGDYYGDRYHQAGFLVWSEFGYRRSYDPLFVYYQTHYRHRGIDYAQRLRGWHEHYRQHEDRRPARTMKAQAQLAARVETDAQVRHSLLGQPIDELMSDRNAKQRFRRLEDRERQSLAESTTELRGLTRQRVEIEAGQKSPSETDKPRTDRLPATPEGKFQLPQTRRFSKSDETRRPPAKSPRSGDDVPARETPKAPETEREPVIPEVDPDTRPGTQPKVPPRVDRPGQKIPPRETEPRTPRREPQPQPKPDPPKTPQPKFEQPKTPELPKVDPPKRPKQPEVDRPGTPRRQPKVDRPKTPRQPETPRRQPEVDRPKTPRQPEVERPETPRRQPGEDRIERPSRRLPL